MLSLTSTSAPVCIIMYANSTKFLSIAMCKGVLKERIYIYEMYTTNYYIGIYLPSESWIFKFAPAIIICMAKSFNPFSIAKCKGVLSKDVIKHIYEL